MKDRGKFSGQPWEMARQICGSGIGVGTLPSHSLPPATLSQSSGQGVNAGTRSGENQ